MLIVCQKCVSLGTQLPSLPSATFRPRQVQSHTHAPIERLPKAVEESDLVEDYSVIVKEGREKLGLTQQDLAFKAKEKLSVIQKIEIGKMLPTMRLSKELEHILRVKLLVPREEVEIPALVKKVPPLPGATLEDVALVRHRDVPEK
jgi:uncharacterized protein (TIGR00270 family)